MSAAPVRLLLAGCGGRMGQVIDRLTKEDERIDIVAGCDMVTPDDARYPVYTDPAMVGIEYDVLLDFSHPSAFSDLLTLSKRTGKPWVVCTTGLSESQNGELKDLASRSAVFKSANMSLGINLLVMLAEKAAAALHPGFDIEIVESHHHNKVDAPSGTAYMIADAIKNVRDGLDGTANEYVYNRHDRHVKRAENEIGMHAIRGGSIVGEHEVVFAGQDEVVKISHAAASRDVFGQGALAAVLYMAGKTSGFHSMEDLIGPV